jgi:spermidine synthase
MVGHQKRLETIENTTEFQVLSRDVSEREWRTLMEYRDALVTAFKVATIDAGVVAEEDIYPCEEDDEDDEEEDKCYDTPSLEGRYPDFELTLDMQSEYRYIYQCETLVFGVAHYKMIDETGSYYQSIDYYHDPETKDTCFDLDRIFQMCGSYRPHYHEMVTHKTARYLPVPPKRVLWVGGGDAMLLHEITKYPSLELAVGLELDQKVTRGAFKHFGVQPQWDNPKVQWWYGDASKSILMLPEEYFGSFDMVLVDLSDTVFSLSVSKKLDVVAALSLLLKPDGVFEMNELVRDETAVAFLCWCHACANIASIY